MSLESTTVRVPFVRKRLTHCTFMKFLALGLEESMSPFLNASARALSRNLSLKISIASSVLFGLALFFHCTGWLNPADYVFLTLSLLIVAPSALIVSIDDLLKKDVNIDVLMTVAALGACLIGRSFEGALLLVLFALSGSLEDMVTLRAKKNLTGLEELVPEKATVVENGEIFDKAVADISVGSHVLVRHGEIVPLDGRVIKGSASVSHAHLTGEAHPLVLKVNDAVLSGARVVEGAIEILVDRSADQSTLARLVKLVTQAHETKPALTRTFEKYGRYYATGIMTFALIVAVVLPFFGVAFTGDEGSLVRALAFLITASPCALVIAVPIAYISSLGLYAKKGIVVKGSFVLDALVLCQSVAFDKTGTLTYGQLKLTTPVENQVLQAFAAVERGSSHPIALAIMKSSELPQVDVVDFVSIAGEGVMGKVLNHFVYVGMVETGLQYVQGSNSLLQDAENARKNGCVTALGVYDGKGYLLCFEDEIRPGVSEVVERLEGMGKDLYILTGDSQENAHRVGEIVGIEHVEAKLKPEDKLERIRQLSREEGLVMIGDGINDAPALARATVGVSMGMMSSATAREASDIILLHDRIDLVDWMFRQAVRTHYVVFQNLILALTVIVAASTSALLGDLSLWVAVLLHEGGTVIVGLNGLRLLRDSE